MADSLRDRLVAAKLAGRKTYPTDVVTSHGYEFRSNEGAADAALPVIADWLRAEAQLQEDEHRYPWGGLDHETSYIVEDLRRLARSITESTPDTPLVAGDQVLPYQPETAEEEDAR